jgi:hypothetical protein
MHQPYRTAKTISIPINTADANYLLIIYITSSRISSSLPAKTFSTYNILLIVYIILFYFYSYIPIITTANIDIYRLYLARSFVSIAVKYSTYNSSSLSLFYSTLFIVSISKRLRDIATICIGDLSSNLYRGDRNNSMLRR